MPFLLRIITGRRKKVIGLFAREGVEMKTIPISDYLLCYDERCKIVRFLDTIANYIINLTEISEEDTLRLTPENQTNVEEKIKVGKIVTIQEGEYKGYSGFVRDIGAETIRVDINIFGRLRQVDFKRTQLAPSYVPEIWT